MIKAFLTTDYIKKVEGKNTESLHTSPGGLILNVQPLIKREITRVKEGQVLVT